MLILLGHLDFPAWCMNLNEVSNAAATSQASLAALWRYFLHDHSLKSSIPAKNTSRREAWWPMRTDPEEKYTSVACVASSP